MDFSLLEPIFARSLVAEDCTGADRDLGYRCSAVETIPTRYGRAIEELIHRSSEPWTGAYLLYDAAHPGTTIFVWNVAYPYHTSMETSARDDSIDVQYVCSRAHSAPISTAHFFACPTLLP